MSGMPRKKLYDMEIDEISLVDRGANQHAAIVISKSLGPEEEHMPAVELYEAEGVDLYDADGDQLEYIQDGDVVYDANGNEFTYIEDVSDLDDFDLGKSADYGDISKFGMANLQRGTKLFRRGYESGRAGVKGTPGGVAHAAEGMGPLGSKGEKATKAGMWLGRNRNPVLIAGGTGAGLTAAGVGANQLRKSLGDVVLEELSKAANEDERSEIIAKAMEEVEVAKAAAAEAWERVAANEDAQLESAFISKAAEFNLPVDPVEFGLILKAASTVLSGDQLDLLEQLFTGVGETLYEEVGYVGDTDNASVLDVVNGYVDELVGKADATPEMISTAIFDSNPGAYDAYIAENRW